MNLFVEQESARQSSPTTAPPCTAEPERWFDRAHRTHALAACLDCPIRRWCAQEALRTLPSWGMWAGVWIDGAIGDVAHHLRAIAAADSPVEQVLIRNPSGPTDTAERPPLPALGPAIPRRPQSVTMAVLARSSGHCEIVSDVCRFTAVTHLSRLPSGSVSRATSAAALYAACRPCAETFGTPEDSAEARRLGYLVDSPGQLDAVPFYWRHARWVLFGRWGQLEETSIGARTAWAS